MGSAEPGPGCRAYPRIRPAPRGSAKRGRPDAWRCDHGNGVNRFGSQLVKRPENRSIQMRTNGRPPGQASQWSAPGSRRGAEASAGPPSREPAATNSAAMEPSRQGREPRPELARQPARFPAGRSKAPGLRSVSVCPHCSRRRSASPRCVTRDRTFRIDRRAAAGPNADRCQSDASGRARNHLAIIDSPLPRGGFPSCSAIEEPGSEIGGDDPAAAEP